MIKATPKHLTLKKIAVSTVLAVSSTSSTAAGISGTDILNLLVAEGILSEEKAKNLVQKVRQRNEMASPDEMNIKSNPGADAIRVTYVPQYMKNEMKASMRSIVNKDIVDRVREDVVRVAREEGWGIKEAPPWVYKMKWSGDARLRFQNDDFASDNAPFGLLNVDNVAGQNPNSLPRNTFSNAQEDRRRYRARFRLNLNAKLAENLDLGMRLVTGNEGNPVSSNQTLGDFSAKWDFNLDLAYLRYKNIANSLSISGGRIKNPWRDNGLIWDSDMTFEGVAVTYYPMRRDESKDEEISYGYEPWDPFITVGVFPIQEVNQFIFPNEQNLSNPNNDKWLYAAQLGTDYKLWSGTKFSIGLGYYHYENLTGVANEQINGDLQNVTTSGFYQRGNSLFNVANPLNPGTEIRLALASEFELASLTMAYDLALTETHFLKFTTDWVKNLAFDKRDIDLRIGSNNGNIADVNERDIGYQFGVSLRNQDPISRDWSVSFLYRYLEGDAILDAFADSDFGLGGTDTKGYIIKASYELFQNSYVSLKWLSADSIDVTPGDSLFDISVDTLQIDLSSKF